MWRRRIRFICSLLLLVLLSFQLCALPLSEKELMDFLDNTERTLQLAKTDLMESQNSLLKSQLELKNVKLELTEAKTTLEQQKTQLEVQSQELTKLLTQSRLLEEEFRTQTKDLKRSEFRVKVYKGTTITFLVSSLILGGILAFEAIT